MFDFHFVYTNGATYDVKNVNKIVVHLPSGFKEIVGDEILSAKIPLETMYLYCSNRVFTVSGTDLMVIDVLKENN